ncbi:hypothetical protein HYQ46_003567 [Verticillium longisporum]|nr:hypothetical protein HYQ46_003567 [Verticillium longisporum]
MGVCGLVVKDAFCHSDLCPPSLSLSFPMPDRLRLVQVHETKASVYRHAHPAPFLPAFPLPLVPKEVQNS